MTPWNTLHSIHCGSSDLSQRAPQGAFHFIPLCNMVSIHCRSSDLSQRALQGAFYSIPLHVTTHSICPFHSVVWCNVASTHGGSSDHYQRAPRGASLGDSNASQRGHEQEKIKNRIAESWHPVPSQPLPVEAAHRRHLFLLHMPSDERRWEQNHAIMDEVTHLFTSCPLGKPESLSRWALFSALLFIIR